MAADSKLLAMQRRFMAALREPIFADSRARTDLPPREGNVSADFVATADALITPSANLEPAQRLELYHRQYWYRLLDSLAEDFPALQAHLGDDEFWGLLEGYLETAPPASFTLSTLGENLADYIAAHPACVTHPAVAEDLARLEYALCVAFDAAEHPPVDPPQLAHADIALQPHVQLLALRTPADEHWRRAVHGQPPQAPTAPAPAPDRFVAAYRHALRLEVEPMPRAAFMILAAIERTHSLDGAMEEMAAQPELLGPEDTEQVSEWFRTWASRGWLRHAP